VITVLLVDDSAVSRTHVQRIINGSQVARVVAVARDGAEAIVAARQFKPDVIAMDLEMPGLDGFEATRAIMETTPTPIVVVCGLCDATAKSVTMRALEAGAVAVLDRPPSVKHPEFARYCRELLDTLRSCSEVRLVRRWKPRPPLQPGQRPPEVDKESARPSLPIALPLQPGARLGPSAVVAIGASTGGPVALLDVLRDLPPTFPLPICVVQHIAAGFIESMASWLNNAVALQVRVATAGERLQAGRVLLAPHGTHMTLAPGGVVQLQPGPLEHAMCPAVSALFRSVAATQGDQAIGVLLTGMGTDGSAELGLMRQAGAVTFAQDHASSLVFGMPGEAVRLNSADHVLPPPAIAAALLRLTSGIVAAGRRPTARME
jgi:two-component system chemotaxis response regulator CheB